MHPQPKPASWLDQVEPAFPPHAASETNPNPLLPHALARLAQALAKSSQPASTQSPAQAADPPIPRRFPNIINQMNDFRKLSLLVDVYRLGAGRYLPNLLEDPADNSRHPDRSIVEQIHSRKTLIRILSEPRMAALIRACTSVNQNSRGAFQ